MGLRDFFKKKKPSGPDPLHELSLNNLQVGYLLDYDLRTWEVKAANRYDWGEGDVSLEWQLESSDETVYLERDEDDDVFWSINRNIAFSRLGSTLRDHIIQFEDPPDEIDFQGVTYYLEESGAGYFFRGDTGPARELIMWSYEDESGKNLLTIEQWGEEEFEASIGITVEEYQFTNILPRE